MTTKCNFWQIGVSVLILGSIGCAFNPKVLEVGTVHLSHCDFNSCFLPLQQSPKDLAEELDIFLSPYSGENGDIDRTLYLTSVVQEALYEKYIPSHVRLLSKAEVESLPSCETTFGMDLKLARLYLRRFKVNQYLYEHFGQGAAIVTPFFLFPYAIDANKQLLLRAENEGYLKIHDNDLSSMIKKKFDRDLDVHTELLTFPRTPVCGALEIR